MRGLLLIIRHAIHSADGVIQVCLYLMSSTLYKIIWAVSTTCSFFNFVCCILSPCWGKGNWKCTIWMLYMRVAHSKFTCDVGLQRFLHMFVTFVCCFFFFKWLIFGGFLNTFCLRQLFYIFFHIVIKKKNQAANVIGIYSGGKGGVKRWICLAHITLDLKKDRSHLLTYL